VKTDVASMAWGLEVRCPFLDHRLVAFARKLPTHMKLTTLRSKRILRSAAAVWAPPRVIARAAKTPFTIPQADWFGGPEVRELLGDVFHSRAARESEVFDGRRVAALVDSRRRIGFAAPERSALWSLLNVHLWQLCFARTR